MRFLLKTFSVKKAVYSALVLYCWITLTACSVFFKRDDKPVNIDSSHSSFIVDELKEGRVVATRINGLPEEIKISYKACFRDFTHSDQFLPGNIFNIHFFENFNLKTNKIQTEKKQCAEGSSFVFAEDRFKISCLKMRTDASGCLNWIEIYPYKMMRQSAWLKYKRAFEGTGLNKGVTVVPLALNPWLSLDPGGADSPLQLVDLRHHSLENQSRLVVDMPQQDITACGQCSANKKDSSHCYVCRQKQNSLSAVMEHFYQKSGQPRLWLNNVQSYISQEHIFLTKPSPDQLKILKQFKVCHLDVQDNCDPPGRFFKVQLELPLRIRVINHRNEQELLPLTRGNYSVKPYLFLVDDRGRHLSLHRSTGLISASLVHGTQKNNLRLDFYFHVPYEHYGLKAMLGLRVQPEGDMKSSVLPFEGVFAFPDKLKTVIGSNHLPLSKEALAFYKNHEADKESFIKTAYRLSEDPNLNRQREGFRRAGWDIELRRLRFSDVNLEEGKCSTPVDRHIRYVGEVCIVDPLTNSVVSNTGINIKRQNIVLSRTGRFVESYVTEITDVQESNVDDLSAYTQEGQREYLNGQKEKSYSSDTSGCLRWVDQMYHKWYNRQRYFVRKMIFSKEEWGFEGERMIAINPWHWGFVFFQDINQIGADSIRTMAGRAEKPRIFLHDFRSLFVEPIYTIDRWLGVNIFQNLLFLFRVKVDRPDDVAVGQGGQRPSAKDVRRGYYFARFILVKSHTEEAGGRGNMVVKDEVYRQEYRSSRNQSWNTNMGWQLKKDGRLTGQMMNTDLEYITHFDTYVQIRDSMVNAYVNFLFNLDEFIFIGSNNRVIVQIFPTDPQYYVFKENAGCEIDPKRSVFIPYTDHELVSQAFLGSFVPSDQRNWNIFRVLGDNFFLRLFGSNSLDDISYMNVSAQQLDRFISSGKQNSTEHKLFRKIQSAMTVASHAASSDITQMTVRESKTFFEKFYQNLKNFLIVYDQNKNQLSSGSMSVLNTARGKLVDSIHESILFMDDVLNGLDNNANTAHFVRRIYQVFTNTLAVLENTKNSYAVLNQAAKQALNDYTDLMQEYLNINLSQTEKQALLNIDKNNNKWLAQSASTSSTPEKHSAFNMDRFAKSEGLRAISFDNKEEISRLLADLHKNADIYNQYRHRYFEVTKNPMLDFFSGLWESMFNSDEESIEEKVFNDGFAEQAVDFRLTGHLQNKNPAHLIHNTQFYQQAVRKNFPLLSTDNFYDFNKKFQQMHLPHITPRWLRTVLVQGIHEGTIDTPEVMSFLHSMCGFWFDDFYEKYLEQYQLDVIYNNHMDHFRYYKSTLEYFLEEQGLSAQYQNLFQAMQEYSLMPMDYSLLRVKNPFIRSVDLFEQAEAAGVVSSLYEDILVHLETAVDPGVLGRMIGLGGGTANPGYINMMKSNRHPYFQCMANPLDFFHIEKKIIVGDIGSDYSDLMYEYGQTRAFNTQQAFDYSYSASWGMSRGFSNSLGSGFTFFSFSGGSEGMEKMLSPVKAVNPVVGFNGIRLSSEWSTGRSDSESSRRQQSLRFAKGLYLVLNHSVMSIALTHYRHCIVIRPHNLAFDGYAESYLQIWTPELQHNFIHQMPYIKSGLLLCTENISAEEDNKPMRIKENYFFLYQPNQGDRGQFLNPLNFRNRPYVITVRGITELEKLEFLIHAFVEPDKQNGIEDYNPERPMTNPFNRQPKPAEGTRRAIRQARIWDKAGFYPGVYSVKFDEEHLYFTSEDYERGAIEKFGEWLYDNNPLGFIHFDDTGSVTRNPAPQ